MLAVDVEELLQAFVLECVDSFPCLHQKCPRLSSIEEDVYGQQFVELQLGMEADVKRCQNQNNNIKSLMRKKLNC